MGLITSLVPPTCLDRDRPEECQCACPATPHSKAIKLAEEDAPWAGSGASTGVTSSADDDTLTESSIDQWSRRSSKINWDLLLECPDYVLTVKHTFIHFDVSHEDERVRSRSAPASSRQCDVTGSQSSTEQYQRPGEVNSQSSADKYQQPIEARAPVGENIFDAMVARGVLQSDLALCAAAVHAPPSTAPAVPASRRTLPEICAGTEVEVEGLSRLPEFNGRVGVVIFWEQESGRYDVALRERTGVLNSRTVKVKRENIRPLPPPPPSFDPTYATSHIDLASSPSTPRWDEDNSWKRTDGQSLRPGAWADACCNDAMHDFSLCPGSPCLTPVASSIVFCPSSPHARSNSRFHEWRLLPYTWHHP